MYPNDLVISFGLFLYQSKPTLFNAVKEDVQDIPLVDAEEGSFEGFLLFLNF